MTDSELITLIADVKREFAERAAKGPIRLELPPHLALATIVVLRLGCQHPSVVPAVSEAAKKVMGRLMCELEMTPAIGRLCGIGRNESRFARLIKRVFG